MSIAVEEGRFSRPSPVAPWRHSALLVGMFLVLAAGGAFFQKVAGARPAASAHPGVIPIYMSLLVMEWGLVLYVWKGGLRRTGTTLREVIGGRWASPRDVLTDLAIAVFVWGGWTLMMATWERLSGPDHAASIARYLPRGPIESLLWILVSLSAGFSEELVFRGYFQRQFAAWTASRWLALLLQAALFGVSHGYQGVAACVRIACFGTVYGLIALWLKSLRPGMMAHAMTDILSGIFRV